ncbi:MAG: TonB-dependent receptor plug domain-containing protein, partial [Bacteroidia bacterium]
MKNWLLIFFVLLSLSGVAQSTNDNSLSSFRYSGSLKGCLDSISKITSVRFNYKYSTIDKRRVEIPRRSYQLEEVLKVIVSQTQLQYDIIDHKSVSIFAPKGYFVYGTVVSKTSGEKVANALISVAHLSESVTTDKDGIFRFYVLSRTTTILVYHEDFQVVSKEFITHPDLNLIIKLDPILALEEVEVNENDESRLALRSFDEVKPSNEIIPTVGGENDALNNVKLLPGVQNVTFGDQGLSIRGGSPDQNNILIDGIPVYKTYHILGLFSVFHPQIISSIKLHKDAFPTKYGSRLSSVVDVSLNNGNKKKTVVEANIGILSSGIGINGPLLKNKISYNLYARRTYADVIAVPFQRWSDK